MLQVSADARFSMQLKWFEICVVFDDQGRAEARPQLLGGRGLERHDETRLIRPPAALQYRCAWHGLQRLLELCDLICRGTAARRDHELLETASA
jgi:hypothetical protein